MKKQIVHSLATVTSDGQDIIFGHVRIVSQSVCLSVRPPNKSASTGRIFMEFYIWVFFESLSRKCELH